MGKKLLGYCTDVRFVPKGIMVTMPVEYMNEISDILREKFGITIEEYLRQCILWTVNEPEQFEKWIEDCRKEYDF